MKPLLSTLIVFLIMSIAACTSVQSDLATSGPSTLPTLTELVVDAASQGSGVPLATIEPLATLPATADSGSGSSSGSALPLNGITLSENGGVFVMHVGDSFLLNLGMDMYDWNVEVDNQNVIQMKMGVMVIRGAQGIYVALNPGTANLTASGNPFCLQSNPPCMMPSLLFRITLIVQ